MAGEWLKFDSSLPDKPETLAITSAMGWDDMDLAVGKLMRLFRWFDQHTIDGNAAGVTPALLDRLMGVTGFVQAVANVGWLTISEAGLALNNFQKHNGATAKSRALTAVRVANHRSAGGNADGVTDALPREEKRREEKKVKTKPSTPVVVPDWIPGDLWLAWMEVRTKKRATNTPYAVGLLIVELEAMRVRGIDAVACIRTSVKSGWSDVYTPKGVSAITPAEKRQASVNAWMAQQGAQLETH